MQPAAGTADTYFVDSPLLVAYRNLASGSFGSGNPTFASSALIVFYSSIFSRAEIEKRSEESLGPQFQDVAARFVKVQSPVPQQGSSCLQYPESTGFGSYGS